MPKKRSGVQHNESIVFFVGDFVSMAMCFGSHLILFMKHIKAAGSNKGRTIKK